MIKIADTGVIFQNSLPYVRPLQAQFPGLCQLSEQEVICVYKLAPAPGAIDSSFAVTRSRDGGKSWNDEGIIWDRNNDDRPYSYGYAYPVRLADGEILLAGYRWDRSNSDSDLNIYNPQTLGAVPLQALIFRSKDGGHRWAEPQIIPPPKGVTMANPSGRIVRLADSRLLLPMETWKGWDDPGPVYQRSLALFSSDNGRSWSDSAIVAMDPSSRIIYWNGMFTQLENSQLLVMYWTKDSTTEKDLAVHATVSQDQGWTWAEPYDTGLIGQMGCSIDIGSGRVLAIYNRRDQIKPGIWAAISQDSGRSWPKENHLLLWDARGREIFGADDQENRSRSIYDEGLMAFGKPDVIHLHDKTFLVGFWCTSNFVMHVRYARLVID